MRVAAGDMLCTRETRPTSSGEVTRADASMGTVVAVQAGLAMRSIAMLG